MSNQAKTKKLPESQAAAKEALIARLLAKASLDFKCCGHGGHGNSPKK